MDENGLAPLTAAQKTYDKFFAQDGGKNSSTHSQDGLDGEGHKEVPSDCRFGRGQPGSSISTGQGGGTGWKPKPIRGAGNARKKMGPTTKAKESRDGNYF